MKPLLLLVFSFPLLGMSQSFTSFSLFPAGDVSTTEFVEADGKLFFVATAPGGSSNGLWVTDGSVAQTNNFTQIAPGTNAFIYHLTAFNNKVYFQARPSFQDTISGAELWITDGTGAGTQQLKDINPGGLGSFPEGFVVFNNELFFSANDDTHGRELWKTDGTAAGTVMVKDINQGGGNSRPTELIVVNNMLYFKANTSASGAELWKSDGTNAGTQMVMDIAPGNANGLIGNITALGKHLIFAADNGVNGSELWISNGTNGGTSMVKDINPGSGNSYPGSMVEGSGKIYFSADDGTHGSELWVSDGTGPGTLLVKDIKSGSDPSYIGSMVYFQNIIYFNATDGINGYEVWKSDGTANGTELLADLNPGIADANPSKLIPYNNHLYFAAYSAPGEKHLFKSDGTEIGTSVIEPASSTATSPLEFQIFSHTAVYKGEFYFNAEFDSEGRELWKYADGTVGIAREGTRQKVNVFPNPTSDYITVELPEVIQAADISIINSKGQVVYSTEVQGKRIFTLTPNLATGNYWLIMKENTGAVRASSFAVLNH